MAVSIATVNETNFKDIVRHDVTEDDILHVYNKWAPSYDKDLNKLQCGNYTHVTDKICDLYPKDVRASQRILDIGAGTGLLGKKLIDAGFNHIDALDPSRDMLEIARERNIYENLFQEYLTERPLHIHKDTYDVIVGIGMLGHKHAPFSSLYEMVRLAKPGGYVILAIRRWYMLEDEEYITLEPIMADIEKAGKWQTVTKEVFSNYYVDSDGLLYIFQVL